MLTIALDALARLSSLIFSNVCRGAIMKKFKTKCLPIDRDDVAPDGSDVRVLLGLSAGSMAHFTLAPGNTSIPVAHKTVDEIWFFLAGRGEFWRKLNDQEAVVDVSPGVCITIPAGTHFQFRSFGGEALTAVAATMPPWTDGDESYDVPGKFEWKASVRP